MKGLLISFAMLLVLKVSAQQEPIKVAGGNQVQIKTSAICEMCKETLEYDLAFEKGVKEAVLNLDDKVMTIVYNPKKTDATKLRQRITKVGYHADDLKRDAEAYEKLPLCCKDGAHEEQPENHKKDHK
jgi:cation transport ATPase